MIIVYIALFLSVVINLALGSLLYRSARKLLQFDELFDLLLDDIDTNINYFEKLLSTPLFMDSAEVRAANENMNLMRVRLEEFVLQMSELRDKELDKEKRLPRPIVA